MSKKTIYIAGLGRHYLSSANQANDGLLEGVG